MLIYDTNGRSPALHVAVKLPSVLIIAATAALGQTCTVSPDKTGGSQNNEPPALVINSEPVAWPQEHLVYYVQFQGIYNTYPTSFPPDYQTAITTAYSNYGTADNNSLPALSTMEPMPTD